MVSAHRGAFLALLSSRMEAISMKAHDLPSSIYLADNGENPDLCRIYLKQIKVWHLIMEGDHESIPANRGHTCDQINATLDSRMLEHGYALTNQPNEDLSDDPWGFKTQSKGGKMNDEESDTDFETVDSETVDDESDLGMSGDSDLETDDEEADGTKTWTHGNRILKKEKTYKYIRVACDVDIDFAAKLVPILRASIDGHHRRAAEEAVKAAELATRASAQAAKIRKIYEDLNKS